MLVDLKTRLEEPAIQELFAAAMYADVDMDEVSKKLDTYKNDLRSNVLGYEFEGEIIAVIGYRRTEDNGLDILHIAVSPDERGHGYGRGIILETIEKEKPAAITAEADEEAVEFYRNIGFTIESLGEKYPSVERFKCTFVTDF